jgi:hypothetical protein
MAKDERPVIRYIYRGGIERSRWCDGYSETTAEGGVLFPWMTKPECRADAAKRGCRAVFEGR